MSDAKQLKSEASASGSHAKALGHYPGKGRQTAFESYTSNSLCTRQTPETFGGVSTN